MLNGRSLVQTLERQYIDFPESLGLYFRKRATITCPFKQLLKAMNDDQSMAIRGNEDDYQYWLIRDSLLKAYLSTELYQKFKGIQLYAHNDFVAIDLECQPAN